MKCERCGHPDAQVYSPSYFPWQSVGVDCPGCYEKNGRYPDAGRYGTKSQTAVDEGNRLRGQSAANAAALKRSTACTFLTT